MTHHLIGTLAIIMSGLFGWMCLQDWRRGVSELPRTGWTVDRRYDPTLFWAFVSLNSFFIAMAFFAGVELLRE